MRIYKHIKDLKIPEIILIKYYSNYISKTYNLQIKFVFCKNYFFFEIEYLI